LGPGCQGTGAKGIFCGIVPQDPEKPTLYFTGRTSKRAGGPRGPARHRVSTVSALVCGKSSAFSSAKSFKGEPVAAVTSDAGTRRDFLYVASGAMGAVGVAAAAWPFIDQMNPSSAALALASIEVDLSPIQVGQQVIFKYRGQPLFVRRRTPKEIEEARAVPVSALPDPVARNLNLSDSAEATDADRVIKPEWLVLVGVCTHLGCTPTVSTPQMPQGDYGGWLCHCHGSQYDTAGRIRKGPAPQNLLVPTYKFLSDTRIKVG
jgi:ubiquinol-cytochrome c reductase iron-sulfur subunit